MACVSKKEINGFLRWFVAVVQCENISVLGLDIAQRTTKDYVGPEISPTLQAALTEALQSQNASVEVTQPQRRFQAGDIHSFLKSACRRKMTERPRSRNYKSNKRHPQGSTPDGTTTVAPYPRSRGLVPK